VTKAADGTRTFSPPLHGLPGLDMTPDGRAAEGDLLSWRSSQNYVREGAAEGCEIRRHGRPVR
jgi:hypothetical protein